MKTHDILYPLPMGAVKLEGKFDDLIRLVTEQTLKQLNYRVLADFFRNKTDPFAAGEFWGKTVRAGSMIYRYSGDVELKKILDEAVTDMLSIQEADGCISSAPRERQPKGGSGSDLWERKYVLLGLLAYYDITEDPAVLQAMKGLADYTIVQVGPAPKTPITETGWAFCGIESSSILEPIVKLYHLTQEPRYLEFATYIVESGACARENLFEAILAGKDPKDIGNNGKPEESIAKAYEMMSCFEGLVEYYRATGIPKWKEAALTFYRKLTEQEITLLGSGGADKPYNLGPGTGEQWNYTWFEQTNPDITLMMETCVTVTWMKLCHQLLRLTGNGAIADEIERSAYNALAGAVRPDGRFFEYFPRFNGTRNPKVNYSFSIDGFDLSCCTANGPSGLGLLPLTAFMNSKDGPVVLFYVSGTARFPLAGGGEMTLRMKTNYPAEGTAEITVESITRKTDKQQILFRVPRWCGDFGISVNGHKKNYSVFPGSYAALSRKWETGDRISLRIALPLRVYDAPHGSNRAGDPYIAFMYGPVMLARDARSGSDPFLPVDFGNLSEELILPAQVRKLKEQSGENHTEFFAPQPKTADFPCGVCVTLESDAGPVEMIDYASAGATWDEKSAFCSWLPKMPKK